MKPSQKVSLDIPSSPTNSWDLIPEESAIKAFSRELLLQCKQTFDAETWSMSGHGVIIENRDYEEVEELLPSLAATAGMTLCFIERGDVVPQLRRWLPDTISEKPTLFFLEPGAWMGNYSAAQDHRRDYASESECTQEEAFEFRETLAEHIENVLINYPVIIMTSVKDVASLDISLRRLGRFDRKIKLPILSTLAAAENFIRLLGKNICDGTILNDLQRMGTFIQDHFGDTRRRDLTIQALQRLAWRERRDVNFTDFLQYLIYGTSEQDAVPKNASERRRAAVHEAGHALVAYINSAGERTPELCSVQTIDDSHGLVLPSAHHITKMLDPTVSDVVHNIRVSLAGRAAEQLVLGAMNISARGASSDLKSATSLAYSMFAIWGISPFMEDEGKIGVNLSVVIDDPVAPKPGEFDRMVREFLEKQYSIVTTQIKSNRHLLDGVVDALMTRPILVREDLEEIFMNSIRLAA